MEIWRNLKRLWRHEKFRKLLGVRIATQCSDGTVQVGMASYVLFSPQSQPNAVAIATVLAITLLPFTVLAPFASVVLDRWSRQRMIVVTDGIRGGVAIALGLLVLSGDRSLPIQSAMFLLLLVAMSLNRFLMAGLTAALPYTVNRADYLTASSIMPVIGPAGVMVGGIVAGVLRLLLTPRPLATHQADAIVFGVAAVLFAISVALGFSFEKSALGPEPGTKVTRASQVMHDLKETWTHLRDQGAASLGLAVITGQRLLFGLWTVAMILGYRNFFHTVDQVKPAIADIGVWAAATGVGFVLSAALVPMLVHRWGLRRTVMILLVGSAIAQGTVGAIISRVPLIIAAFFIGLFAQALKSCIDTLCQAHVDGNQKGRVFVLYDILFNAAVVVAAFAAIWLVPSTGFSTHLFIALGVGYLLLAGWVLLGTRRMGDQGFNSDTHTREPAARSRNLADGS